MLLQLINPPNVMISYLIHRLYQLCIHFLYKIMIYFFKKNKPDVLIATIFE